MQWICKQPSLKYTRRSTVTLKISHVSPWHGEDTANDDCATFSQEEIDWFNNDSRDYWTKWKELHKQPPIHYLPATFSLHWFRYKGHYLAVCRQPYKDTGNPWTDHREKLILYSWSRDVIRDTLDNIRKITAESKHNRIQVYQGLQDGLNKEWTSCISITPRALSTVVFDPTLKTKLIDDLKDYLHPATKAFYKDRGIPYRRGYLLHGPPGTGKSSLCHALASLAGLDIYTVSLNSWTITGDALYRLFSSLPSQCIVLFEDVDQTGIENRRGTKICLDSEAAGDDNEDKYPDLPKRTENALSGITLSEFLNVIDGVPAREGRILIMTTNKPENLDEALIRPGRVDLQVRFTLLTQHTAKELFLVFNAQVPAIDSIVDPETMEIRCELQPIDKNMSFKELSKLSDSFASKIPAGQYSSAQLQYYLMQHRGNAKSAESEVERWMQRMDDEKKKC
ncbi:hypothetical protein AnigIFM49718_006252 [Aspergillus niger]|nr:hypothetical protein AnigIFM49718_006252 [Aspergillus niger]